MPVSAFPDMPELHALTPALANLQDAGFHVAMVTDGRMSGASGKVPAGGVGMLNAIGGPLPDVTFCPTGGISIETAPKFLACKNVACVGGSWLTPKDLMNAGQWDQITELARAAAALRPQ